MPLVIDASAASPVPDPSSLAAWAGDQRVFISSVMSELRDERAAVAEVIRDLGAEPVWFEEFGGRDDDAEVAYLSEVASSTIYLGILGRTYGRMDRTRLSATHIEYRAAESQGLNVSVWVRGDDDCQGDQPTFVNEVRVFHTTGNFSDPSDLASGVRRRLARMAAGDLSPWVKLGSAIFRAHEIRDDGQVVAIKASLHSPEVLAAVVAMRPGTYQGRRETLLTHSGTSAPVKVRSVVTRTTASRGTAVEIELGLDPQSRQPSRSMTFSFSGSGTYTPDDLAVLDLREMLFGDEKPSKVLALGGRIPDFRGDLPPASVATETFAAAFSLLLTEALVGSGRAKRVGKIRLSPAGPEGRQLSLIWIGHSDRWTETNMQLDGLIPQGQLG